MDADRLSDLAYEEGCSGHDQWTRDSEGQDGRLTDALVARFKREAKALTNFLPRHHIERFDHATRRPSLTHEEAVSDFLNRIDDALSDFVDHDALERSHAIAEGRNT